MHPSCFILLILRHLLEVKYSFILQIKVFVQEIGLKRWPVTNMDYLTSEWPGTPNFKVDANFNICSLKSMGKSLQNELWARPVSSKLYERRLPTLGFLVFGDI